ncbi:NCS2 family permease [uncultured Tyzzerella sp.]|uniref:NCS2 family permease n=1 Tax=uncultured Tyzzerella sp. TaxID=2321398 RepID=UPI0029421075|nr:NCS2 family permease [uncultured Tyzzerella sp.]
MNLFKLKENGTNVSTEVLAGITIFMTMAYILVVNPNILSATGMDKGAVFTATALAAFLGCIMMALLANYPFGLAPGMGLNAYFAYTVANEYGWQLALLAVFIEGIVFLAFSFFNIREAIFNSVPKNLKNAVSVGLGVFITFIGLQNAGIVIKDPATAVALGNIKSVAPVLAMLGVIITAVLTIKKVKGSLFWGILITWGLGIVCQITGIYQVDIEQGQFSLIPQGFISAPPSIKDINIFSAIKGIDFDIVKITDIVVIVFAFLFVDMFDTIGTLIGVSEKAKFLDENGRLPKLKQALLADAVATTAGAMLGTSTTTTFVESASGVAEGGRTGLTSTVTGLLFLVALVFSPIFIAIPGFATAPTLIIVGLFMIENVVNIEFNDYTEGLPAFITIIMMPFTYSIADGLIFGFLSYVFLKLLTGKGKEVSKVMYILSILFILKLIM